MDIREAVLDDADDLGRIHVAAWQVAYRGLLPDDYLDGLAVDDRAAWWRNGLAKPVRQGRSRLVAEEGGRVIGFVVAGPADGDDEAGVGEIYSIYVHPDSWGRRAGRALLTAGVEALERHGFEDLILWVHPDNRRACDFYERAGWTCDGTTRTLEVHGVEVPEIRYRRGV